MHLTWYIKFSQKENFKILSNAPLHITSYNSNIALKEMIFFLWVFIFAYYTSGHGNTKIIKKHQNYNNHIELDYCTCGYCQLKYHALKKNSINNMGIISSHMIHTTWRGLVVLVDLFLGIGVWNKKKKKKSQNFKSSPGHCPGKSWKNYESSNFFKLLFMDLKYFWDFKRF